MGQSAISLNVSSPDAVPIQSLSAIIDPEIGQDNLSGEVRGSLSVTGTLAHPRSTCSIIFNKVELPQYDLHNLTGKLDLKPQANKLDEHKAPCASKARACTNS